MLLLIGFIVFKKLEDEDKRTRFAESKDIAYFHPESAPYQGLSTAGPYGTKGWDTKHYVRLGRLLTFLKQMLFLILLLIKGNILCVI